MNQESGNETEIPLGIRLRLSHANFQFLAEQNSIDLLHVKGYAFGEDTYRPGRQSTDIDVLVRPAHVDSLVEVLTNTGWKILTRFETGSIFEHAMTVYHPSWGLVDIHREFPGLGYSPEHTFERLWEQRREKPIAAYRCSLPSLIDSQIIVLVHAGRSRTVGNPEVDFIMSRASGEEWAQIQARVAELDAEVAFAAAINELERYKDQPDYLLWKSVSEETPDHVQWRGRLRMANGLVAKARVLCKIFVVNRDHLAMELGYEPSRKEIWQRFYRRFMFWKYRKGKG